MRKSAIKTASNMSDETYRMLCEGIREKFGNDIEFVRVIDESVIGGFVLKLDGVIYDHTIRTQLQRLKKHITE